MLAQCSNTAYQLWDTQGGYIGIQTANPQKPLHIFSSNVCTEAAIRLEYQGIPPYWGHLALICPNNLNNYSFIGLPSDMILQADDNAGNVLLTTRNKGKAIKFSTTPNINGPQQDRERFRISDDGFNTLVDIKATQFQTNLGNPILRFQRVLPDGNYLATPGNRWNMGIDVTGPVPAFKFGAMDSSCALFDDTRSFTFSKEGNLGIGTGNPLNPLQIKKGSSSISLNPGDLNNAPYFSTTKQDDENPNLFCHWNVSYGCDMMFTFHRDANPVDMTPGSPEYQRVTFTEDGDVHIARDLYISGKIHFTDFTLDHWNYNANWGYTTTGRLAIGEKTIDSESEYWANSFLSMYGKIVAKEIVVIPEGDPNWSDFVFDSDYELIPLDELEKEIKANKHLPGIPSAEEIKEKGQNVSQIQAKLLQKIEELTLYVIDLKKENEQMKKQISEITDNKR